MTAGSNAMPSPRSWSKYSPRGALSGPDSGSSTSSSGLPWSSSSAAECGSPRALKFDFVLTSAPVIILQGAGATILVSALAITFATILAVFGALARLSTNPIPNAIGSFYVSLFRGTPLLLQIYFAYFALPQLGLVLPALIAGGSPR